MENTMSEEWKSPRKIEEEIKMYQRKRFEDYMEYVDMGIMSEEEAIASLRSELSEMSEE